MLTKEQAEKISDNILQQEVQKNQLKEAQQAYKIPWIYRRDALGKVPVHQQYSLYKQAKCLMEEYRPYKKFVYVNVILAISVAIYLLIDPHKIEYFGRLEIFTVFIFFELFILKVYQAVLIKTYFNKLIRENHLNNVI